MGQPNAANVMPGRLGRREFGPLSFGHGQPVTGAGDPGDELDTEAADRKDRIVEGANFFEWKTLHPGREGRRAAREPGGGKHYGRSRGLHQRPLHAMD